jgi:hypothetical protein
MMSAAHQKALGLVLMAEGVESLLKTMGADKFIATGCGDLLLQRYSEVNGDIDAIKSLPSVAAFVEIGLRGTAVLISHVKETTDKITLMTPVSDGPRQDL